MSETTPEKPMPAAAEKPTTTKEPSENQDAKPQFDSKKAEKFGFIDFDALSEDVRKTIEPRFKRLYSDFKTTERALKELREINTAVMAKIDRIESTSTSERINSHLATLKQAAKKAAEDGDLTRMTELTDQLVDWKVKLATSKSQPVKKEPDKPTEQDSASAGRQLTTSETGVIKSWINEEDDDGRSLRPWAQDGHRLQGKALKMVEAIFADDDFRDAPIEDVLAEADRLMKREGPVRRDATAVLDPDSGPGRSKGRVTPLSDDEKHVAERMYGGKAHEAHEKYRRAKALVKGT